MVGLRDAEQRSTHFFAANLGSEPRRKQACRGSHIGATILHHNTKVLDFQGLFVFLGVKNNLLSYCTFFEAFGLELATLSHI